MGLSSDSDREKRKYNSKKTDSNMASYSIRERIGFEILGEGHTLTPKRPLV